MPLTDKFVIVESPVLVAVTVIVTGVPAATVVPGLTLFVVSAVAARMTVIVPLAVELSDVFAVAVHAVVAVGVNVQLKSTSAPPPTEALAGNQFVQPVPMIDIVEVESAL